MHSYSQLPRFLVVPVVVVVVAAAAAAVVIPIAGPQAWNQLPASLRNMDCNATFKRHLKTILFEAAYGVAGN